MADAPDWYGLFAGDEPTAQERAKAIAQALTRRQQFADTSRGLGALTALGQNDLLGGISQNAMLTANAAQQDASQGRDLLAEAGKFKAGEALKQALAKLKEPTPEELELLKARIALTRAQGEKAGREPQPPSPQIQVVDIPGKGVFRVDKLTGQVLPTYMPAPGAASAPAPMPGAAAGDVNLEQPVTPQQQPPRQQPFVRPAPIGEQESKDLVSMSEGVREAAGLAAEFEDNFAGLGPKGELQVDAEKKLGSWATEPQQRRAAFWAKYDRLVNLPERNQVFGSSLSSQEKASWDAAKTASASRDPARVRAALQTFEAIARRKLGARAGAAKARGVNLEELGALTGGAENAPEAGAPATSAPGATVGGRRVFQAPDGTWMVED